jgi:hypothetical protein
MVQNVRSSIYDRLPLVDAFIMVLCWIRLAAYAQSAVIRIYSMLVGEVKKRLFCLYHRTVYNISYRSRGMKTVS